MKAVGSLWTAGVQPNWPALYGEERRHRVSLPTYPFERKRYWLEVPAADQATAADGLAEPVFSDASISSVQSTAIETAAAIKPLPMEEIPPVTPLQNTVVPNTLYRHLPSRSQVQTALVGWLESERCLPMCSRSSQVWSFPKPTVPHRFSRWGLIRCF